MRKSVAVRIFRMINENAYPTWIARMMLNTGNLKSKILTTIATYNFLDRLTKQQIGLKEVERQATIMCNTRGTRDAGYVNYVMRGKRNDAAERIERFKQIYRRNMQYLMTVVEQPIMHQFCGILNYESETQWINLSTNVKRKAKARIEAVKPWKKHVRNIGVSKSRMKT